MEYINFQVGENSPCLLRIRGMAVYFKLTPMAVCLFCSLAKPMLLQ